MEIIKIIIAIFATLGAVDYIFGNRFGLGKEFENAFMLLGTMMLTTVGMIVISPGIATLLSPVFDFVYDTLHMDPSIIPASLFANDMGGAALAEAVMKERDVGMFNALVVSTMMGCTISYTIPFALGVVEKKQHRFLLLGLLCGIVTIPVGCFAGGLVCGIALPVLLYDLLPLIILAAIIGFGLLKFPNACVKIFAVFGRCMTILILLGLVFGVIRFLTGFEVVGGLAPLEEGVSIALNAAVFLAGAFPFVHVVSRLLRRPLRLFGRLLHVNETSALCLLSSLASSAPTFGMMRLMDDKGCLLNSAFSVSGAFVIAAHLAFTVAYDPSYIPSMVVGKLVGGVLAVVLALFIGGRLLAKNDATTEK